MCRVSMARSICVSAGGTGRPRRQRSAGGGRPASGGRVCQQGLVDEYVIFIAGKFLGSAARPLLDWPLAKWRRAAAQNH
jgi:diaminohydroxyphosphoribosylaminopyrimidine deaminase/5-amino-6-(5-phosphoribosylamino)uracil reductase